MPKITCDSCNGDGLVLTSLPGFSVRGGVKNCPDCKGLGYTQTHAHQVYLDYHATTPVDMRVLNEMMPYLAGPRWARNFGNPSSNHEWGHRAAEAVENARKQVANLIGAKPNEIYFTSGATESNNTIIKLVDPSHDRYNPLPKPYWVRTSPIEHSSVLELTRGCKRIWAKDFNPQEFISGGEWLVSYMLANNEVGIIHPIAELANRMLEANPRKFLFHCDASQGLGYVDFNVSKIPGLHFASLSSHKIYGPKGVGAMWIREGMEKLVSYRGENHDPILTGLLQGGGQERGLRSGTLNVPGIVGFGAAADIMYRDGSTEADMLCTIKHRLFDAINQEIEVHINGNPSPGNGSDWTVLPQNLNLYFPGIDAEQLMMAMPDIACSTGSACSANATEPSHILKALYPDQPDRWTSSLRFAVGRYTIEEDVDYAAKRIVESVRMLA